MKNQLSSLCELILHFPLWGKQVPLGLSVCLWRPRLALAACVQIQVAGNLKQASKARLCPRM